MDPRPELADGRPRRAWPLLLAGAALGGLAGCIDLGLVREVAFPPGIAGLPSDEPWMALPVGVWLTDGEVEARAIAACVSPRCPARVVVGLFRARGREAARIDEDAAHPGRLAAVLAGQRGTPRTGKPRTGAGRGPATAATVETVQGGAGARGFLLRMATSEGARPVWAEAVVRPAEAGSTVLLVVGDNRDVVRRLAGEVGRN